MGVWFWVNVAEVYGGLVNDPRCVRGHGCVNFNESSGVLDDWIGKNVRCRLKTVDLVIVWEN